MLRSGFFNSVNGDRKYNAQNMTEYFEGLFSSGVVGNPTTSMQVQALSTPAMAVQVLAGKAFIDGYWAKNDGAVQLPIEAANVAVPRIDAIVLRLNLNEAARNITFQVITGTASDTPTAPDITRTDTIKDYLLATVYVGAGVTAINSGDITDQRASTDCGYVIVVGSDGDPAVINTIANGMYMATGTNDNIALSNLIQNFLTGGDDYKQLEIDVYGELGITNPAKTSSGTVTWFNFASASKTTRRVKLDFSHTTRISITAQASIKNVMFDTTNSNVEIANLQAAMYQTPNGSIFSGTSNPTVTESAFWLNGTGSETLIGAYQGTFLDCRMSVTNNTGAAYGFSGNGNVLRLTNVEAIAMNASGSSNESVGIHVMGNQTNNVLLMTNCTCPLVTRSGYKQDNVVKVNSGYYSLVGNTLGKAASLYSTGTGKTEIGTIYYTGGGKTTIDTDATLAMEGIPADAKATGDQLSDLNQALNDISTEVNPVNIFDQANADFVEGYYIAGVNPSPNANYEYTNLYTPIEPNTLYYYYQFNKSSLARQGAAPIVAYYDANKNYLSYVQISSQSPSATSPADAKYVRLSSTITLFTNNYFTVSKTVPTTYEEYFDPYHVVYLRDGSISYSKLDDNLKAIINAGVTYITVATDGSGDFTRVQDAIASITDASEGNKYVILIKEGTYDLGSDFTAQQLADITFQGIIVPDFVTLRGIGNPKDTILQVTLSETNTHVSALNFMNTSGIENLTVKGTKTRYVVHDDRAINNGGYTRTVKNCIFIGIDLYYSVLYGCGLKEGANYLFQNCIFESGGYSSVLIHNNVGWTMSSYVSFENCRMKTTKNYALGRAGMLLRTLMHASGSSVIETHYTYVTIKGNDVNGILLKDDDAQIFGSGNLFKVSGYANAHDDYEFQTGDGLDHSADIDLINFTLAQ